ncbi:zinc finger domain-containing protein [Streptomyces sp. NPDC055681]
MQACRDAPAGSSCRTRGGRTTTKYHPPRFVLLPALREELEVPVPADRGPGRTCKPPLAVVPAPRTLRAVRSQPTAAANYGSAPERVLQGPPVSTFLLGPGRCRPGRQVRQRDRLRVAGRR